MSNMQQYLTGKLSLIPLHLGEVLDSEMGGHLVLGVELMTESMPASMMSQMEFDGRRDSTLNSRPEQTVSKSDGYSLSLYQGIRVIIKAQVKKPHHRQQYRFFDQNEVPLIHSPLVIKVSLGMSIALKGKLDLNGSSVEFSFPYRDEPTLK